MVNKQKILICDDDNNIAELISLYLIKECFETLIVNDGESVLPSMETFSPNLILLDIMLPGMDGYQVCREVRAKYSVPIIMLSAKGEVFDKVLGLELGADDYMVKPFLPKELVFRIAAILRRTYKDENPLVTLKHCEIDFERAEVLRRKECEAKPGRRIPLTAKEYEILLALYRNAGRIVTIDTLCEAAWGDNPYGYENSLMAHIRRIREKIEAAPSKPESLITVKGLGYKLIVQLEK